RRSSPSVSESRSAAAMEPRPTGISLGRKSRGRRSSSFRSAWAEQAPPLRPIFSRALKAEATYCENVTIPYASPRGNTVNSARRRWAAAILVAAAAAALVPLPRAAVERFYSQAAYLVLQRIVTAASNRAPFALFDVLLVALGA